ncbi:apolipoprotein N-acyltransferase [Actinomyces urogenitalis]|uniref:Apolipoprotein N-acyltransferase n=1 Tax=Actinomyces urogenitalis TaxID=103621 RepID=A0A2I1KW37_9ACTO|nr:apolipoprotein N-acyltransferase [Actinomyces urogenitalis]
MAWWAWASGCGLAVSAGFAPLGAWWAVPLGLGGIIAATTQVTWGSAGARGLFFGLGMFTPLFHFTAVSMGNALGWVSLTVVESLYLVAWAMAWSVVSRLPVLRGERARAMAGRALAAAVLFGGVEELRSSWPWGGFPFGRLAFAMADAPSLPFAAYGGSLGLSILVALTGACVAEAVGAARRLRLLQTITAATLAGALILAPVALPVDSVAQDGTIRVGAVQGDVADSARAADDAFARALEVTGNHAQATLDLAGQEPAGSLDLVVWPENAADLDPRTHSSAAVLVEHAAHAAGAPVLVGAVAYEDEVRYNDVVVWTPGEGAGQYYRKHRPVPFGEYIPWRQALRRLTSQVDRIGTDMVAGTGPVTLTVHAAARDEDVTVAMGICFEVAYDDILRQGVEQGGSLIVIPTNNASFGRSTEAAQQLAQGRVQAVVHGRSVVQVSTVGLTGVITPKGVVVQELEPFTRSALAADVGLRHSLTVADRLGAWPGRVVLAVAAALYLTGILCCAHEQLRRRRRRRH